MKSLSLMAIFKNETMGIKLWIEHYLWQGVEKFYLIDNGSTDNPLPILKPYIKSGIVKYIRRNEPHRQVMHYRKTFKKYVQKRTKWLIVCDLDEFLFGLQRKLIDILKDPVNHRIAIIYNNWILFGSDHLIDQPPDIRQSIIHRQPGFHSLTKYIINTKFVKRSKSLGIHLISDYDHLPTVNMNDQIHLNHYPIQSLEYFTKVKMTRGDVNSQGSDHVRDLNYFHHYDTNTTVFDDSLKKLIVNGY